MSICAQNLVGQILLWWVSKGAFIPELYATEQLKISINALLAMQRLMSVLMICTSVSVHISSTPFIIYSTHGIRKLVVYLSITHELNLYSNEPGSMNLCIMNTQVGCFSGGLYQAP